MELRQSPAPVVRSWVIVAETDPTLEYVDVACFIESSTEFLYSRLLYVPPWPPSLANPGQYYPALLHVRPTSSWCLPLRTKFLYGLLARLQSCCSARSFLPDPQQLPLRCDSNVPIDW